MEGNYVLLYDLEPWAELRELFDDKWFISCPEEISRDRVFKRHLEVNIQTIAFRKQSTESTQSVAYIAQNQVGGTPEEATFRLEDNDLPNARIIAGTQGFADYVIETR